MQAAATDSGLVFATWGLVAVTAILVAVNTIPPLLERRRRLSAAAARLVPDMDLLRTRLQRRSSRRSMSSTRLDEATVLQWSEQVDRDLEMLSSFMDTREAGLELVSELYVCRHLMTSASLALFRARIAFASGDDPESVRERDESVAKAARCYRAAIVTLDTAEGLLPSRVTRIEKEVFGTRFSRVSDERETDAAKWLTEQALSRSKRQGERG